MLIEFKVKSRLTICYLGLLLFREHQVLDVLLAQEGAAEDSYDLVDVSVEFHFVFDYSNEAICGDGCIDLYPYGILGISPKRCYLKMLLYPFEELMESFP